MLKLFQRRRPRFLPTLAWILFAATAAVALSEGLKELSTEIRSYRWDTTQGEVHRIERHRGHRNAYYAYHVGGGSYSASQNFIAVPFHKLPTARDRVTVYYDPSNPEDSLLTRGIRFDGGIPLIIASFVILAILLGTMLPNRNGARKQSSALVNSDLVRGSEISAVLSTIEQRLSSPQLFGRWASEQWGKLEQIGPLGIAPVNRAFAPRFWAEDLNIYGLLYAQEDFVDITHYFLLVWYTSSIQQFIAEGNEFELADWFVPGVKEEQIVSVESFLRKLPAPTEHEETCDIIDSWKLPSSFDWMKRLDYLVAWIKLNEHDVEMTAVCEQGYLSFFALRS